MAYKVCLLVGFLESVQRQIKCHSRNCFTSYCLIAELLADVAIKAQYLLLSLLLFKSTVALSICVVLPYIYFNKYLKNVI